MKFSKRGLTLTEVITTLALSSVVIVAVLIGIQSFSGQFVEARRRFDAKIAASLVCEAIDDKVSLARKALIDDSINDLGYNMIESRDGRLYYKPLGNDEILLIDEKNYYNQNCNVIFFRKNDNNITVQIIIYSGPATKTSLDTPTKISHTLTRDIRLANTFDSKRKFGTNDDKVSSKNSVDFAHILRYII